MNLWLTNTCLFVCFLGFFLLFNKKKQVHCCQLFREGGGKHFNLLSVAMSWHDCVFLCDSLTHTHIHNTQTNTYVMFRLGWPRCDKCMKHCRIPHWYFLVAHQILFFIRYWLTFTFAHDRRDAEHFLWPIYSKNSCSWIHCLDLKTLCGWEILCGSIFRWRLGFRQSNMYHSYADLRGRVAGNSREGLGTISLDLTWITSWPFSFSLHITSYALNVEYHVTFVLTG